MAVETKSYRFVVRMPAELGERLRGAAARSGRSLHRELVTRLEESLADELPSGERRVRRTRTAHESRRGEGMTRRRRHALGFVVVALLAISALVAAVTLSGTPAAAPAGGELPSAFSAHLGDLRAAPHSLNPGGPSSFEEE